jgi:hypothetical protein
VPWRGLGRPWQRFPPPVLRSSLQPPKFRLTRRSPSWGTGAPKPARHTVCKICGSGSFPSIPRS